METARQQLASSARHTLTGAGSRVPHHKALGFQRLVPHIADDICHRVHRASICFRQDWWQAARRLPQTGDRRRRRLPQTGDRHRRRCPAVLSVVRFRVLDSPRNKPKNRPISTLSHPHT